MFQDSLMESLTYGSARRRSRSLLMGIGLQLIAVSALVLYPLLHPEVLPSVLREPPAIVVSFAQPPEPVPANTPPASGPAAPIVVQTRALTQPRTIPSQTYAGRDVTPPQVLISGNTCHAGCAPIGIPLGHPFVPVLATARTKPFAVSSLQEGQILSRVQPVYPAIAKATRTQGTVVLHAIIGRDGNIENLRVASSDSPLLNDAALQAVSQWKFRPYILNGSPIEVGTQIMVNFRLSE